MGGDVVMVLILIAIMVLVEIRPWLLMTVGSKGTVA
jgi:hypothetical protein